MLHINQGRVRLSFCTDKASRTAVTNTATAYGTLAKAATAPASRRSQAHSTMVTAKDALPSSVFGEVGDQRYRPNRRPTIDA